MDIYTFLTLSKEDQELTILNSYLLSERQEGSFNIRLYAIADFYVEVNLTLSDEITRFKAFKSRRLLIPFLDDLKFIQEDFEMPVYN